MLLWSIGQGHLLSSGIYNWNRRTWQLGASPHRAPDLWNGIVGNAKQRLLELPLPEKTVNQKLYRIVEINAPSKDLKDPEGVIPTTSPFDSPTDLCRRRMDHGQ